MARAAQLTLDLARAPTLDFASYHAGCNGEAVRAVEAWASGAGAAVLWLSGAPASGKTHLLQAAIRAADARGARAMYVPLAELRVHAPAILDDLQRVDCLALDDADGCRGDAAWERGLFRLYNELRAASSRLLWSGTGTPAQRCFALADLASRASASLTYQLRELSEGDKAAALEAGARRRGLELAPAAVEFILRHARRDMAALAAVLDRLDRESLARGRALTLPFVREVLAAREY